MIQGKSKPILDYIKEHGVRNSEKDENAKGKKGRVRRKTKNSEGENLVRYTMINFF